MPRIKVRTDPGGERIVGTPNSSTLTITLIARAQRSTLQLQADAKLLGGSTTLEHWVWEFPDLPQPTRIELVSEPGDTFDPPDRSGLESINTPSTAEAQPAELRAVQQGLKEIEASLRKVRYLNAHESCSFCGHGRDEVNHMVAGPIAMICDACIAACGRLFAGRADDV